MGKAIVPKKIRARASTVQGNNIAQVHVYANKVNPFNAPITLNGKVAQLAVNKAHNVNISALDLLTPTLQTLFTALNSASLPKYAHFGYTQAHRQTFGLCLTSAHSASFKGVIMYHGVFAGQNKITFNNTAQGLFCTQAQALFSGVNDVVVYPFKTYCFVAFKASALPTVLKVCNKVLGISNKASAVPTVQVPTVQVPTV